MSERSDAYDAAIRLLARREHSRLELHRKLVVRGHGADAAEETLAALADEGLQSEQRFAESFVRAGMSRGQGALKIRAGLRQRGIADELAKTLLDFDDDHWRDQAAAALRKRFGAAAPGDRAEWAKRMRFLAGRGFPRDVAMRALGSLDGLC